MEKMAFKSKKDAAAYGMVLWYTTNLMSIEMKKQTVAVFL
jgi:dsDNA-binding SOS-regulon protein